jgi:hypothetical protein
VPNHQLLQMAIENHKRSPNAIVRLEFAVSQLTTAAQLEALRRRLNAYLESQPLAWKPSCMLRAGAMKDAGITLSLWVSSHYRWDDPPRLFRAQFLLNLELLAALRSLGIAFRLADQSLHVDATLLDAAAGGNGSGGAELLKRVEPLLSPPTRGGMGAGTASGARGTNDGAGCAGPVTATQAASTTSMESSVPVSAQREPDAVSSAVAVGSADVCSSVLPAPQPSPSVMYVPMPFPMTHPSLYGTASAWPHTSLTPPAANASAGASAGAASSSVPSADGAAPSFVPPTMAQQQLQLFLMMQQQLMQLQAAQGGGIAPSSRPSSESTTVASGAMRNAGDGLAGGPAAQQPQASGL